MVKNSWLIGPRISSTLPMAVYPSINAAVRIASELGMATLFSRNMGALKYGTFVLIDSHTSSPSHAWTKVPISSRTSVFLC